MSVLDYASVAALAELTSRRLARDAATNRDLREALETTQPAPNAVRIGACEIRYRIEDGQRVFDVTAGELILTGVAFYETARYIVYRLNSGVQWNHPEISEILKINTAYRKAREDVRQHAERIAYYSEVGNAFKADLHEDRYSRATIRSRILQQRLLDVYHPYL